MENMRIEYLYRDGSNYKKYQEAVTEGILTEEQIDTIFDACDDGEYFIPEQVGLPADRLDCYERSSDDHPWLELLNITESDEESSVNITSKELCDAFTQAKGQWDISYAPASSWCV